MKKIAYILVAVAAIVALSSCKCKKQEAVACCENCTCEVCECTEGNCTENCCAEKPDCCETNGDCDKAAEGCTEPAAAPAAQE